MASAASFRLSGQIALRDRQRFAALKAAKSANVVALSSNSTTFAESSNLARAERCSSRHRRVMCDMVVSAYAGDALRAAAKTVAVTVVCCRALNGKSGASRMRGTRGEASCFGASVRELPEVASPRLPMGGAPLSFAINFPSHLHTASRRA